MKAATDLFSRGCAMSFANLSKSAQQIRNSQRISLEWYSREQEIVIRHGQFNTNACEFDANCNVAFITTRALMLNCRQSNREQGSALTKRLTEAHSDQQRDPILHSCIKAPAHRLSSGALAHAIGLVCQTIG